MSYEPTNWKTGDVVTSAKLNKLENGVANGGAKVLTVNGIPGKMQKGLTPQDFVGAWIFDQDDNSYTAVTRVRAMNIFPYIFVFENGISLFYNPDDGYMDDEEPSPPVS